MKHATEPRRRRFLRTTFAAAGALLLAGCEKLSQSKWFPKILAAGEDLNQNVHQAIGGRRAMAQEFPVSALSPDFRSNGTSRNSLASGHISS